MKPSVSIIVPAHNVEKTLDYSIASILQQSFSSFEVLLIENGSSDRTPDMCRSWAEKDPRIRVHSLTTAGYTPALNYGLDLASGDYITFVDSDDFLEEDCLKQLVNTLESTGADVSCCGIHDAWLKQDGSFRKQPRALFAEVQEPQVYRSAETFEKIFAKNATVWSKLYRRDIIGEIRFDPEKSYGADNVFLAEVFFKAAAVAVIGYRGYNYVREREGSIVSAPINPSSLDFLATVRQVYHRLAEAGLSHVGIYRLQIAAVEVLWKLPNWKDPAYAEYVTACWETLRTPSKEEKRAFFQNPKVPVKKKLAYFDRLGPRILLKLQYWKAHR